MNKPSWLIPVVVCAVLLLAWPFRWERGPMQNYKTYTVRHMHDRWTGDNWVYRYSPEGVSVFPAKSSEGFLIVLPKPGMAEKKAVWELKLSEAKTRYMNIMAGREFKEYNSAMDRLIESYLDGKYPRTSSPKITMGAYIPDFSESERRWERTLNYNALFQRAWNELSPELRTVGASALEAERQIKEAEKMLAQIEANAYIKLLDAYGRRNLATGIWAALVVASGVCAWRTYLKQRRDGVA